MRVEKNFGLGDSLGSLIELNLSYNKISELEDEFFVNFRFLRHLNIGFNR